MAKAMPSHKRLFGSGGSSTEKAMPFHKRLFGSGDNGTEKVMPFHKRLFGSGGSSTEKVMPSQPHGEWHTRKDKQTGEELSHD
jgi:hypothetical protein